jgi:hypothetical protein
MQRRLSDKSKWHRWDGEPMLIADIIAQHSPPEVNLTLFHSRYYNRGWDFRSAILRPRGKGGRPRKEKTPS